MAGKEHIRALMREIGPQMALAQVTEFEVEGTWTLIPDEDTVLFADYDEAGGRLVLSAEAGRPVDSGRLGLYDLLLRYNNSWAETGGVRMALDGAGTVVQLFDLPSADLDLPRLQAVVTGFIDTLRAWREIVGRAGGGSTEAAFGPMLGGMIRG